MENRISSCRPAPLIFVNSREFAPNRAPNREESALLRALLAPGGADEAGIARGCPASLCTAP
jgi:hypothetical protein